MALRVSAPGKLFVVGEYGVLLGGPAVVATVDRRLVCRIQGSCWPARLELRSAELAASWETSSGPPDELPQGLRFAAEALRSGLAAARPAQEDRLPEGVLQVEIEQGLDGRDSKLGLGGSSAVVAAVLAAVQAHLDGGALAVGEDRRALAVRAMLVHRKAQGGGSGVDAVAAVLGGTIFVRASLPGPGEPDDVESVIVSAIPLRLPESLKFYAVATKRAASSGPRADRFIAVAQGQGPLGAAGAKLLRDWSSAIEACVMEFRDACHQGESPSVLAAFGRAGRLLTVLERLAGLPIQSAGLRRACAIAAGLGVVAKPSGAGGGDCAIAIVQQHQVQGLCQAWREGGLEPLDLRFGDEGIRLEEAA